MFLIGDFSVRFVEVGRETLSVIFISAGFCPRIVLRGANLGTRMLKFNGMEIVFQYLFTFSAIVLNEILTFEIDQYYYRVLINKLIRVNPSITLKF